MCRLSNVGTIQHRPAALTLQSLALWKDLGHDSHRQEQAPIGTHERREIIAAIEGGCPIVDRIDDDGTGGDYMGGAKRPSKRIHEQVFAKATALGGLCD